MAASVQESRRMSSLNDLAQLPVGSLAGRRREAAPAERGYGVKRVLGEKSDRFLDIAFGQFGRRADKVHGHADARAASEIGPECDVLFSGNAETVVEQADGAGWTDGGYYRGNGGPDRLNDNIAEADAYLPGRAPRSTTLRRKFRDGAGVRDPERPGTPR